MMRREEKPTGTGRDAAGARELPRRREIAGEAQASLSPTCRICGTPQPFAIQGDRFVFPGSPEPGVCAACWDAEVNSPERIAQRAAARSAAERVAVGIAREYSAQAGWQQVRYLNVRRLEDRALVRMWAVGAEWQVDQADAERMWRELGDGYYVVELGWLGQVASETLIVEVHAGVVTARPASDFDGLLEPAQAGLQTT